MAAELQKEPDVRVALEPGGFGEFTVLIDGVVAVRTNRFLYPSVGSVLKRALAVLRGRVPD